MCEIISRVLDSNGRPGVPALSKEQSSLDHCALTCAFIGTIRSESCSVRAGEAACTSLLSLAAYLEPRSQLAGGPELRNKRQPNEM